jgi:hypothetical protein
MIVSWHFICFSFLEATGQKLYQALNSFLQPLNRFSQWLQKREKKPKDEHERRQKSFIPLAFEQQRQETRQSVGRNSSGRRQETRKFSHVSMSASARRSKLNDEDDILTMYGITPTAEEQNDSYCDVMHNTFTEDDDDYELPASGPHTSLSQSINQTRIAQLEEELTRLRSEISRFMAEATNRVKETAVPPPPPPPPPPPLQLAATPVDLNAVKTPRSQSKLPHQATPMSLTALLQQVALSGKPQLRHVEGVRSPGGTIQRPKPLIADPQTPSRFTDSTIILANALKQRFKRVSQDSVESSPEVTDKSKSLSASDSSRICENEDKGVRVGVPQVVVATSAPKPPQEPAEP